MTYNNPNGGVALARSQQDYATAWANLLPQGTAWPRDADAVMQIVIFGLAGIWGQPDSNWPLPPDGIPQVSIDNLAALLLGQESNPQTTTLLLPDWERAFGLPDLCLGDEVQSISARQNALVERIATVGGQSRPWFEAYANQIGYSIEIIEHAPYMCGVSTVGDTVGSFDAPYGPRWELGQETLRFYWSILPQNQRLVWFMTGGGGGQCGVDHMVDISFATDLECAMQRYHPAHTYLTFGYADLVPPASISFGDLQTFYPGLLTLNGGVIMVADGGLPDTPPAAGGMPWSNGNVMSLTPGTSDTSPTWVSLVWVTTPNQPNIVFLDGTVLEVST